MTGAGSISSDVPRRPVHVPKCAAKRAESMVAEVMTTLRSGRSGSRRAR